LFYDSVREWPHCMFCLLSEDHQWMPVMRPTYWAHQMHSH
jgi:hypothetical protein